METEITYREVVEGDREFLEALFVAAWARAFAGSDLPEEMKQRVLKQQFAAQHTSYRMQYPKADYRMILLDGDSGGRIYVDRGPEVIALMEITLLPEHRNRGVGTRIMRALQEEASAAGKPIDLYVEQWNPDARRWYDRLGFAMVEDLGSHWRMEWRGAPGG